MYRLSVLFLGVVVTFAPTTILAGEPPPKTKCPSWEVPYRMTGSKHVMVRAKINGEGPYNFIVDSGAPALIVATSVCDKLGVKPDDKKWGMFDKFAVEGGPNLTKEKVRVEDMFQLEGMNALGMAGVKLHGVIGYSVLARYRLEFDFNSDTMTWTELDYSPAPFKSVALKNAKANDLTWVGNMAKGLGAALGKEIKEPTVRGYLGIELDDTEEGVVVTRVLPDSPAAVAGMVSGDRITHARGRKTKTIAELLPATADVAAGKPIELTVVRGSGEKVVIVKTGEGL
jgi:hypothetical protein